MIGPQCKTAPAQIACARQHHGQGESCSHRSIRRVATALQHLEAHLRSERMFADNGRALRRGTPQRQTTGVGATRGQQAD